MARDYLDETADNLFNSLNSDPFMGHDSGSDGNLTGSKSIFDSNDDPFASNMQPQNSGTTSADGEKPKDFLDVIIYSIIGFFKTCGLIIIGGISALVEIFKILGQQSADESINALKHLLITCGCLFVAFLVCFIFGYVGDNTFYFIGQMGIIGMIFDCAISGSALGIILANCYKPATVEDLDKQVEKEVKDDNEELNEVVTLANDYNQSFDEIMNDILGDDSNSSSDNNSSFDSDLDSLLGDDNNSNDSSSNFVWDDGEEDKGKPDVDNLEMPKGIINTASLYDSLHKIFPAFNPNYAKMTSYETGSDKWTRMFAIIGRVFADIYGKDESEVIKKGIELLELKDSVMCAYLTIKKPIGNKVTAKQLEDTMNNYSSDIVDLLVDEKRKFTGNNAKDKNKISCSAELDGDHFNVIITKPNKDAILIGDIINHPVVKELFTRSKDIPLIIGVDSIGEPIIYEMGAKGAEMYSGTFAGGPGSGKSWFFMSLVIQLLAFYLPEMVQIILVDPKGDAMFNKFALHPNVCRLIQGDNPRTGEETFNMIKTLIDEGTRRQEMFATENTANIQGWRKKGHKLPTIFCFIDEVPTLKGNIKEWGDEENAQVESKKDKVDYIKEWDAMLARAVTKLRSSGIYVYLIAQRLTNYIDKTTRDLTPFRLVLRSMDLMKQVFDESEIKDFTKTLINAGDAAIKLGEAKVQYARTLGVCLDDEDSYNIIEALAKEFYKMGVEMPDMSVLGKPYVKNIEKVKAELYGNKDNIVQFDDNSSSKHKDMEDFDDEVENDSNDSEDNDFDFGDDDNSDDLDSNNNEDNSSDNIFDFGDDNEDNNNEESNDGFDLEDDETKEEETNNDGEFDFEENNKENEFDFSNDEKEGNEEDFDFDLNDESSENPSIEFEDEDGFDM